MWSALRVGSDRGARRPAGAAAAARRSARRPGQADQGRFHGGVPQRPLRDLASMTGTVWESVGAAPDDAALRDAIRRKVEAAGTSFYWAMRLLPQARRDGMYAVYAFCREVDDIADDEQTTPVHKKAALAQWHEEIDALYAGHARHQVARALRDPVAHFRLRREDFHTVIDGMEMDAAEDIRAPDLATLDL